MPGLGSLSLLPGGPPGQQFWWRTFCRGARRETAELYLCCEPSQPPDASQRELPLLVLADPERFLHAALALLAERLAREPAFFGVSAVQAARYLEQGVAALPFGQPEFTFYPGGSWLLRFAEGALPVSDPHGIGVLFQGEEPCSIEDLSSSDPIDGEPDAR